MQSFKGIKWAGAPRRDRVWVGIVGTGSVISGDHYIVVKSREGWATSFRSAAVTPATARQIAAALLALADEIEGAKP